MNPKPPLPDQAFADHCRDLLGSLGPIKAQRMFGGWGFKCDGLMVGLIYNDELYLKVDAVTKPQLLGAGGRLFIYETPERRVEMSYVTAPEEAMDAQHFMVPWARLAMEAALRSANAKSVKKVPRKAAPAVAARAAAKASAKSASTAAKKSTKSVAPKATKPASPIMR